MSTVELAKLTIKADFIKTISLWICTLTLFFKMGIIYSDFKARMVRYDTAVNDIDTMKVWKNKVEAYYMKPKADTIFIKQ